ncbi:MAG TPA: ABC transporter permease [Bacteroidales bacterium]|nr:ABC transporter permease [Bacteroidales bacterium]
MSSSLTAVVQREIRRILHDRVYLFMWIVAPVIGFTLIILIFSANVPSRLPVAVIDRDHTSLSRKMIRMIGAAPVSKIDQSYSDVEAARKAFNSGAADAIVVIPSGMEKSVVRGEPADVAIYLNNVYLIKASQLKSGIQKAIATLSAGIKLRERMLAGESGSQALSKIMAVQLVPVLLFNPYTSYEYYLTMLLLPALFTVFLLFGTIYALGTELQYRTGEDWLMTARNSMPAALFGKLIPHTLWYFIMALVMNLIFFQVLGLPLRGHFLLILVSELVLVLSYQSMAIFLLTITRNLRLALSLASAYTMLALTYAGMTFPSFGMPAIAQLFGRIFPLTYWLEIFSGQTLRGEPLSNGIVLIWLMVFFIVAGFCMFPRYKYLLKTDKFQGKI